MNVFKTKEECLAYAVETYGALQIEMEVISIVKVGPSIAKFLSIDEGFAVSNEL